MFGYIYSFLYYIFSWVLPMQEKITKDDPEDDIIESRVGNTTKKVLKKVNMQKINKISMII